jgi:Flp pilus assembly protein TadD
MEGVLDGRRDTAVSDRGRSQVSDAERAATYYQNAALFIRRRQFAEAEPLLQEALRLEPHNPDILNKLGAALWELGRPHEAEPLFVRAHELRPDDVEILNNLGLSRWDQGRPVEAAECYRRALEIHPDAIDPRMNLGVVLSDLGEFDESLELLRGVTESRPDLADPLQNYGMTLARLGRWDEALEYYERALRVAPNYAEIRRNRAYARLYLGDFERGWPEHEWRLKCRRHAGYRVERPEWGGESLPGKIIVLHFEQGYGDTLQFVRFAPMVKQRVGLVVVLCQTRLLRIVSRVPGVDLAFDGSTNAPNCQVHASLMSLPAIFGTTMATVPSTIPYLFNDPVVLERWESELTGAVRAADGPAEWSAGGPRRKPFLIGVAWQGSPDHLNDRFRSFPLACLAPLAERPGVRLVSLQIDHGVEQVRSFAGRFPVIELKKSRPRDFLDTAAIVSQLDLVITPDTAVAHLAGGLGVPVWTALSTIAEWRWMLDREDSPWYPTMRLFRQTKLGDWDTVSARMAEALDGVLAERAAAGI